MCTSSIHIANIAQTRHKPQLCRLFPKESVGLFRVFPIPYDPYPQRQQIAGNAAGVEWGRMENTAQKGLSKGALRDSFATTAANHRKHCRCGMGPNGEYGSERLVEGGTARETYHNGSKSRETLPMQKPRNVEPPLRGTSRAIPALHPLPQRHRITPNTAVAEISRIVNLFHLINDFTANLP